MGWIVEFWFIAMAAWLLVPDHADDAAAKLTTRFGVFAITWLLAARLACCSRTCPQYSSAEAPPHAYHSGRCIALRRRCSHYSECLGCLLAACSVECG